MSLVIWSDLKHSKSGTKPYRRYFQFELPIMVFNNNWNLSPPSMLTTTTFNITLCCLFLYLIFFCIENIHILRSIFNKWFRVSIEKLEILRLSSFASFLFFTISLLCFTMVWYFYLLFVSSFVSSPYINFIIEFPNDNTQLHWMRYYSVVLSSYLALKVLGVCDEIASEKKGLWRRE